MHHRATSPARVSPARWQWKWRILGILRWDPDRNAIAAMFGDNFEFVGMRGEWQSPSIVMYDRNYNVLGIPATATASSCAPRRQLWPYQHDNPDYSTILPCDFIQVIGDLVACRRHGDHRTGQRAEDRVPAAARIWSTGEVQPELGLAALTGTATPATSC